MKILHNKLPMSNDGRSCLLSVETQRDLHTYIQESVKDLDEQYVVITTPTDITE